ncbi:hypothetical protein FB451DRAFT_1491588 [Mycena latifolia]|nr:hypothetical protein FB451DRAFT_1491588 [Mycena latifolia]
MPHERAIAEPRFNDIIASLSPAIPLLHELQDAFGTPFVQAISNTISSLITAVETVKRNKNECVQLMENIHGVLYAIIILHITSETGEPLSPTTLVHIGKFTETLHKIHMFVQVQQDGNKIRNFFRQSEMSTMLKECREGIQQAMEVFKSLAATHKIAETMHKELLELISTLSDETISDKATSKHSDLAFISSKSFSLLPSEPKIFHGRESELEDILKSLQEESPRIAILGAGGMGKTSLARATLHHPDIATRYQDRFFVACDSVTSSIGIAALLGTHMGLKPGKDLTQLVIQAFARKPHSLLILDNLETAWEPRESRGGVEELLSLLTDIKHLALIQADYPGPYDAAWQTFIDIAEDCHENEDINHLLRLTNNMPLAVDLIAHLASYEGCSNVLSRWQTEGTSLLSKGHDKGSSLDASITLSLSSPRMESRPGARDLLSLLSILPDGLSDAELFQCKLSIRDIMGCKATLLGTSLAYIDDHNRLRSLVPIREHVLQFHPPGGHLIEPLCRHFQLLLDLYQTYRGQIQMVSTMNQISSNLGNLQQILRRGLHPDNPDLADVVECIMSLNSFCRLTAHGWLDLMDTIPNIFPQPCDHRLEIQYIIETFNSQNLRPVPTPEVLVAQAISHFHHFADPSLESKFYHTAGNYYFSQNDPSAAMQFLGKALRLARASGNTKQESQLLDAIANLNCMMGDYTASWINACEAQRLAQRSANCYEEADALRLKATCCSMFGDYKESIVLLNRGRELLKLCGLSGGAMDFLMAYTEATVHQAKSEYAQAQRIHTQILQNTSAEQNPYDYAFCLLSISELDVIIGTCKDDVHHNLNTAKRMFKMIERSHEIIYCTIISADLHLRERDTVVAKTLFEESLTSSWGKLGDAVSYCLQRLADISQWKITDFGWTSRWTVVYLVHSKMTRKKLELHKALQFLGDVW